MVIMDRNKKDLVVPKSLGNFVTEGGSGGGITPEQAAEIASAVTEAAIDEYDTELQVDLEDIREAVSGNSEDISTLSATTQGIAEQIGNLSGVTADISTLSAATSANTENIASLSAATEAISESLGGYATTAVTDELATAVSGITDSLGNYATTAVTNEISTAVSGITESLGNYATTAVTDALSAVTSALTENLEALSGVTSGLTEAVAGKQDTLSAGNGIDLSGNTISVKIGEGLAFSGDTLVTSGGGGAATYILNRMSQQERKDLFDELFEYRDGYGVSSGFPAGNYAFYYNEDNGDSFKGLIPLTIVMMHPTDYGGGIFFTGLAKDRYNGTNLRLVRYVITSDGSVDENRYGAGFGISTDGFNFSWTGAISVDLDNGNIIKRGDETLVYGNAYVNFESDSSLSEIMQQGLKFEPANNTIYSPIFKISLINSGTTKTYYKPVMCYEEISPVTIGGQEFSTRFTFIYTKEDGSRFKFSFMTNGNQYGADFQYQALS